MCITDVKKTSLYPEICSYKDVSKSCDSTCFCSLIPSRVDVRCGFLTVQGFSLRIVLFPKDKSHPRKQIAQILSPVYYTSIVLLFQSFNTHLRTTGGVCVQVWLYFLQWHTPKNMPNHARSHYVFSFQWGLVHGFGETPYKTCKHTMSVFKCIYWSSETLLWVKHSNLNLSQNFIFMVL